MCFLHVFICKHTVYRHTAPKILGRKNKKTYGICRVSFKNLYHEILILGKGMDLKDGFENKNMWGSGLETIYL